MSQKRALILLPFSGWFEDWVNPGFVKALEREALGRGERWFFKVAGQGVDGGELMNFLDGLHLLVVFLGGFPLREGVSLGWAASQKVPVVAVDVGIERCKASSFLKDLGVSVVDMGGVGAGEWETLAKRVWQVAFPERGGDFPGLERHGLSIRPPRGYSEICRLFGSIEDYVREDGSLDPSWEEEKLGYAPLPFSIPLSWAPDKEVRRLRCHKLLVPVFEALFQEIEDRGFRPLVRTYGGCFCFRRMRGGGRLSTHSWGIAIDLNPDTNPLGSRGDMAPELVGLFGEFGFTWGGNFSRPDPMHFQFCSGY